MSRRSGHACQCALLLGVALGSLCACASGSSPAPKKKGRFPYRALRPPVAYEMMRDTPDMLILDLRAPEEFEGPTGHVRRAQNVPLPELPRRLSELEAFRDDTFLVYCRDTACADQGLELLRKAGFDGAVLLEGGIDGWIRAGFRTVLPAGVIGRPGNRPRSAVDAAGPLRPLRPGEKAPAPEIDHPEGPPPPL